MRNWEMASDQEISHAVIGCAMRVHDEVGPGLLERVYQVCLIHELGKAGLKIVSEVPISVQYDGIELEAGFRADIIVEERLLLELKSIKSFEDIHLAQMMTYLRLTGIKYGLLINFNVKKLKNGGIKRVAM
jgi:GxxExxY protein